MVMEWPDVPLDVIYHLARRMAFELAELADLVKLADLVRLGVACKTWRTMLLENNWLGHGQTLEALVGLPSLHLPKLMIPDTATKFGYLTNTRSFFDWSMEKTFQVQLPETNRRYCCGSNNGWLVITDSKCNLSLLNIITRKQIMLPTHCSPDNHRLTYLSKAIIIGNPSKPRSCIVAAISNRWLIVVKLGTDKVWTRVESITILENIVHYQGLLYGINPNLAKLEIWNMNPSLKLMMNISLVTPFLGLLNLYAFNTYFVEVDGEFIVVGRDLYDDAVPLVLKLRRDISRWEEVEDLGDCSLFLGYNTSIVLSPVPAKSGFRKNCIYLCHRSHTEPSQEEKSCNALIYSMKDKLLQKVLFGNKVTYTFASSIWVTFHHEPQ